MKTINIYDTIMKSAVMMDFDLPKVPEIGWFELEILYLLQEKVRYGNEIRVLLNEHMGQDSVTTGKLYPVLKKMDKAGYIRQLKQKKLKKELSEEEKEKGGFLTRGVDRRYYEITQEGEAQVDMALNFTTSMLFNREVGGLYLKMASRLKDIMEHQGEDLNIGMTVPNTVRGYERGLELLPTDGGHRFILFSIGSGKEVEVGFDTGHRGLDIRSFLSKYDDLPLKGDYLDIVISTIHLSDAPNARRYLSELLRTVKPGGLLIIIGYLDKGSVLLDRILQFQLGGSYTGEDLDDVRKKLKGKIVDIKTRSYGELFMIYGYKRKKGVRPK